MKNEQEINNTYQSKDAEIDSANNDEDQLGYNSKYDTSKLKEENKDEIKNDKKLYKNNKHRKYSNYSTSISISPENNNSEKAFNLAENKKGTKLKQNYLRKNSDFDSLSRKDEFIEYINGKMCQRKMSSPLCCYFCDSEKYLSQTHEGTVDINNSLNFVKKDVLLTGNQGISYSRQIFGDENFNNNDNNECYNNISKYSNNNEYFDRINKIKNINSPNNVSNLNNNIKNLNCNSMNINNINSINPVSFNNNINVVNNNFNLNNINKGYDMNNSNQECINYLNNYMENEGTQFLSENLNIGRNSIGKRKFSFNQQQMSVGLNGLSTSQINIPNIKQDLENGYNYPQLYNYMNLNYSNSQNNIISKRKLSYNFEEGIISQYFNNILNFNNNNGEGQYPCHSPQQEINPMLFTYIGVQENRFGQMSQYQMNQKNPLNNNNNTNTQKSVTEKKPFDKRKGDWSCPECHNLNFAFRTICNRCHIPKPASLSNNQINHIIHTSSTNLNKIPKNNN